MALRSALLLLVVVMGVSASLISFVGQILSPHRDLKRLVHTPAAPDASDQQPVDAADHGDSARPFRSLRHAKEQLSPVVTLVTVASDTHMAGYVVLDRSARHFGVPMVTLGQQGRHRKELKLEVMRHWLRDQNPGILCVFTDGYDTLLRIPGEELRRRVGAMFAQDNATIIFSTEKGVWPERSLKPRYPRTPNEDGYRYLNAGGYIGRAGALSCLLDKWDGRMDDQLFFTMRFLNQDVGCNVTIRLDYDRLLFQSLHELDSSEWALAEYGEGQRTFARRDGQDAAALVHGNGGGKALLGYLSNYEAGAWTEENGSLWHRRDGESPYVQPTLVLTVVCNDRNSTVAHDEFARGLMKLQLDHRKTALFLWRHPNCTVPLDAAFNGRFADVIEGNYSHRGAHEQVLRVTRQRAATHLFLIESGFVVERPDTLQQLVQDNLTAVIPFASNQGSPPEHTNFVASMDQDKDLSSGQHRGLWRVECWSRAILIRRDHQPSMEDALQAMAHGDTCRPPVGQYLSIVLDNRYSYGRLIEGG
ncbi:unnamed protein product [Vitrella brassicaformis CCMP3155]|uniref:PLOD1-3-like GT domain-containing protein n=1 Tax=Vitrella brassicaformis (strain CCMP3155) TaxID=1169540 RepID=A0A0G4FUL0_VITBC|nr:unnamed protein product [Vitrella brassicaformis CCMP3155]|eukprot:CEM18633.1 unnamed protein product [Vitrella brassicaformis CCMP3155]